MKPIQLIACAFAMALACAHPCAIAAQRDGLHAALQRAHTLLDDLHKGRIKRTAISGDDLPMVASGPADRFIAPARKPPLAGTWRVTVPAEDGSVAFHALQTFAADGTFVETSSLLATLVEGPAHGVWTPDRVDPLLTFELFAFDEHAQAIGYIRVRNRIELVDDNHFLAQSAVDILPFGEEPILNVGGGPFRGERVVVRPLE